MTNRYEPIRIRPLRLKGVFGVAWMLLRRGFWGVFLYALAVWGWLYALSSLAGFGQAGNFTALTAALEQFGASPSLDGMFDGMRSVKSMSLLWGLSVILSLFGALAVQPVLSGGLFSEMSARVYGQATGAGGMLRRWKYMLKGYFATNVCCMVAMAAALILLCFAAMLIMLVVVLLAAFSAGMGGAAVALILCALLLLALLWAAMCFFSLVYPVAVNEGKRCFQAVARSARLVRGRFGRMYGVTLLYSLAVCAVMGLIAWAATLLISDGTGWAMLATAPLTLGALCFLLPWQAALYTTLYYDARVRTEGTGWLNEAPAEDTAKQTDGVRPAEER